MRERMISEISERPKKRAYLPLSTLIVLFLIIALLASITGCNERQPIPKTQEEQPASEASEETPANSAQEEVVKETSEASEITEGIEPAIKEAESTETELDINQLEEVDVNPEDIEW